MDYSYLLLIIVTLVMGLSASGYMKRQLSKYSKVPISSGLSGVEAAQQMLNFYNLPHVTIKQGKEGEDHYDPRSRSVSLSPSYYDGRSVTAVAVAYHEVAHACQHAEKYMPMQVRSGIFPVVNIASNAWMFLLLAGIILNFAGLITLAIIFYACAVVFQIVTLPVEFNASRRALDYMNMTGVSSEEKRGASSVLRACALTYVAAALTSILQLLWLLSRR